MKPDESTEKRSGPAQIIFAEQVVSKVELASRLVGRWNLLFHCNGTPLSAGELYAQGFFDGYLNPMLELDFGSNSFGERILHSPIIEGLPSDQAVKRRFRYEIFQGEQGDLFLHFSNFQPVQLKLLRTVNTTPIEEAIEFDERQLTVEDRRCRDGNLIKGLLVRIPVS